MQLPAKKKNASGKETQQRIAKEQLWKRTNEREQLTFSLQGVGPGSGRRAMRDMYNTHWSHGTRHVHEELGVTSSSGGLTS